MNISELPTIPCPFVDGELEYYPLGEAHIIPPSDADVLGRSTWEGIDKVELNFQAYESSVDIACIARSEGKSVGRYKYRLTNPRRMEISPKFDDNEIPLNVRRAVTFASFIDVTAPRTGRPYGLDYLCSLHAPLAGTTQGRHPLIRLGAATLSATLKIYALGTALEISISEDELNFDKAGLSGEIGDVFRDNEFRIRVAKEIIKNYTITDNAVLPKARDFDYIQWYTEDPLEEPPYTVPASRDHREKEYPYVNIVSLKSEGQSYIRADVFSRCCIETLWFRVHDRERGVVVLEDTKQVGPDRMPPIEVIYELYSRGFTVSNVPQFPEGKSLPEVLDKIETIVSRIDDSYPISQNYTTEYRDYYRDLFTMLYSLDQVVQKNPELVRETMDQLTRTHTLPIETYASSPIESEHELIGRSTIEQVTELISDVIAEVEGGDTVREILNDLRWDGELID